MDGERKIGLTEDLAEQSGVTIESLPKKIEALKSLSSSFGLIEKNEVWNQEDVDIFSEYTELMHRVVGIDSDSDKAVIVALSNELKTKASECKVASEKIKDQSRSAFYAALNNYISGLVTFLEFYAEEGLDEDLAAAKKPAADFLNRIK